MKRAWPYRALDRATFDSVLLLQRVGRSGRAQERRMTANGFATRRGRRAALVHRDEANGTVRGRRGARLIAQTSGGAIPEIADYRVILDPDDTFIGTLNKDFAIESIAGERIRTAGRNRIVYRGGAPLAVVEAGFVRELAPIDAAIAADVSRALKARRVPALNMA